MRVKIERKFTGIHIYDNDIKLGQCLCIGCLNFSNNKYFPCKEVDCIERKEHCIFHYQLKETEEVTSDENN